MAILLNLVKIEFGNSMRNTPTHSSHAKGDYVDTTVIRTRHFVNEGNIVFVTVLGYRPKGLT